MAYSWKRYSSLCWGKYHNRNTAAGHMTATVRKQSEGRKWAWAEKPQLPIPVTHFLQ